MNKKILMSKKIIMIQKIGFQLLTESPFIICMHHIDHYPMGNDDLGPNANLSGRQAGQDFSNIDGFSMYHGDIVPGFPEHPHRGFETVTVVLEGLVDHFDSKGSEGRYGSGDTQWFTTGKGCQHSEMFPLVNRDKVNELELFQIWINLSAVNKFVEPHYKMLWNEDVPYFNANQKDKKNVKVKLIAGVFNGIESLTPTPYSWAATKANHVRIMLIEMEPHSELILPAISENMNRNLYYYRGEGDINIDHSEVSSQSRIKLNGNEEISIFNGLHSSYLMLLEGEPINEPMVQYGPFVMNTSDEIKDAFREYQSTEFGGWAWKQPDPVHERNAGRFAKHADGKEEIK